MDPKLIAAAAFALLAGGMWVGFVRAAPRQTALGTITAKVHKPEGTYQQAPSGLNRGFRVPTNIPIAESYLFNIKLDSLQEPVATSLNVIRSRQFEEGQRVKVTFERRGFGPFLRRIRVVDLAPS
jgi:hypothetical protein